MPTESPVRTPEQASTPAQSSGSDTTEVAAATLRNALRCDSNQALLQVHGECMRPLIRDCDEVVLEGICAPPNPGEIVVAADEQGEIVCHRVIDHAPTGEVIVCGDRSSSTSALPMDTLVGVVRAIRRGRRTLRMDGWMARRLARLLARHHRLELRNLCCDSTLHRLLAHLHRAARVMALAMLGLSWIGATRTPPTPDDPHPATVRKSGTVNLREKS